MLEKRKSNCYWWCYCLFPIGQRLGQGRPVAGRLATELHPVSAWPPGQLLLIQSAGQNTEMKCGHSFNWLFGLCWNV